MSDPRPNLKLITVGTENLSEHLESGALDLHPAIVEGLPQVLGQGAVSMYVALTANERVAGQMGIKWTGPNTETTRSLLGLVEGEAAAQIGFLQVPEALRGRGIATWLVKAACDIAEARDYRTIFGTFEPANLASKRVFHKQGFTLLNGLLPTKIFTPNEAGEYGEPQDIDMQAAYKRLR